MSCSFDDQIVLERASEDPHARHIGPFARLLSEQGYSRDSIHRQVLCARWFGHERVGTTQIHLEATIATEEKALAKNILAGWTTGSLYTWGPTPRLPEESVASKGLCRVMSGGFATRRPEFSVQNPQRRSVTRHSQEGHIVTKQVSSLEGGV